LPSKSSQRKRTKSDSRVFRLQYEYEGRAIDNTYYGVAEKIHIRIFALLFIDFILKLNYKQEQICSGPVAGLVV
jgi:hypothetical protein